MIRERRQRAKADDIKEEEALDGYNDVLRLKVEVVAKLLWIKRMLGI